MRVSQPVKNLLKYLSVLVVLAVTVLGNTCRQGIIALEYLEEGKAARAKKAVEVLQKYTAGFQQIWDEKQQVEGRRTAYSEKLEKINSFRSQ